MCLWKNETCLFTRLGPNSSSHQVVAGLQMPAHQSSQRKQASESLDCVSCFYSPDIVPSAETSLVVLNRDFVRAGRARRESTFEFAIKAVEQSVFFSTCNKGTEHSSLEPSAPKRTNICNAHEQRKRDCAMLCSINELGAPHTPLGYDARTAAIANGNGDTKPWRRFRNPELDRLIQSTAHTIRPQTSYHEAAARIDKPKTTHDHTNGTTFSRMITRVTTSPSLHVLWQCQAGQALAVPRR